MFSPSLQLDIKYAGGSLRLVFALRIGDEFWSGSAGGIRAPGDVQLFAFYGFA